MPQTPRSLPHLMSPPYPWEQTPLGTAKSSAHAKRKENPTTTEYPYGTLSPGKYMWDDVMNGSMREGLSWSTERYVQAKSLGGDDRLTSWVDVWYTAVCVAMTESAPAVQPICLLGDEQIAPMSLIWFPRQWNRFMGKYTCQVEEEEQETDILIGRSPGY